MHFLIDGSAILRDEDGIGTLVKNLVSEMATSKHSFEIVGFADQRNAPRLVKESKNVSYTFLPMPKRVYGSLFKLGLAPHVNRWLSRTPDAVFYCNFVASPKVRCKRKVLMVHDLAFIDQPQTLAPRNLGFLAKFVPKSINEVDQVISIAHATADRIKEAFDIEDVAVAYPSVDLKPVKTKKFIKQHDIEPGYILALGTLEPRKNYEMLVEAYMNLPDELREKHQLVFGGKVGWKSEELMAAIEHLQSEGENIVVTGFVPDESLAELYTQAGVLVMPSLYEGFGIPPLEAFACKTPVVANLDGALKEAVGEAGIHVIAENSDSIKEGIRQVLIHKEVQKELIVAGTKQLKKFDRKKSAKVVLSALEARL